MPGRPRTTLKRLNELLQHAEDFGSKLYSVMPLYYREQPDLSNPMCAAWRRAAQAAIENYRALDAVRTMVAGKVDRAERLKGASEKKQS